MSEQATEQRDVEAFSGFGVTVEQAAQAFYDIIQYEIDEIFAGDVEAWQHFNASIITLGELIARNVKRQQRAAALRRHVEVFALCVLWALLVSVPLTLGLLLIAGQL
jgi:hypothetical protein